MRPQSCDVWEPETTFWFAIIKVGTAVTPIFRLCALLSFISCISGLHSTSEQLYRGPSLPYRQYHKVRRDLQYRLRCRNMN